MQLQIDMNKNEPLYVQIYNSIKSKIKIGQLKEHTKLPSQRILATTLGVSRNTVDLAYSQLLSEGYIISKPKSGYYISSLPIITTTSNKKNRYFNEIPEHTDKNIIDFSPYGIDINYFPYHTWKKLSKETLNESNEIFELGPAQGDEYLRTEIDSYITNFRLVNSNVNNIIIGAGSDYLLQLLSQLIKLYTNIPSPSLAIENTTYMKAFHIFEGNSYKIIPLKLDEYGLDVNSLHLSTADVAYVTPTHQYPLGKVMPIQRRLELLKWSQEQDHRFIIEDDHDSEFRYKGKPIPSLQGIDRQGKVVYLGTFSRALTPSLRIAYLVLPDSLLEIYNKNFFYLSSTVSRIDQRILAKFMEGGYFERHLNKMRKHYKTKHDFVILGLKRFGSSVCISGDHAGLHIVTTLKIRLNESELMELALQNGIKLYGVSSHFIGKDPQTTQTPLLTSNIDKCPTILLGYGNLTLEEINKGLETLYQLLQEYLLQ